MFPFFHLLLLIPFLFVLYLLFHTGRSMASLMVVVMSMMCLSISNLGGPLFQHFAIMTASGVVAYMWVPLLAYMWVPRLAVQRHLVLISKRVGVLFFMSGLCINVVMASFSDDWIGTSVAWSLFIVITLHCVRISEALARLDKEEALARLDKERAAST